MQQSFKLTILFPCLNEAETLQICIERAQKVMASHQLDAEIVVADNGSDDGSIALAESLGARVVHVPIKGYGAALRAGIDAAKSQYVVFADADDSYYVEDVHEYYQALARGAQFVIGNRFAKGIEPGSMPWKNQHIGNPVLSLLGRILFGGQVRDWHCGMRGVDKQAFVDIPLICSGMEFASELVAKAQIHKLAITQVPTGLRKDGRSRNPHLRPWRDGVRHVTLLLKLRLFYSG